MKKQNSREMSGEAPAQHGRHEVKVKHLIANRECHAPGYGSWKAGDLVTDPKTVAYLVGNPNFSEIEVKEKHQ